MEYTISQFKKDFPDNNACLDEIFKRRFSALKVCPNCKRETNFHKVRGRKCYACQFCSYQLHPLAGTIFHKSTTPLWLWFYAIFLFSTSKNGVSAKELQRCLGCTYKTAWRIANKIRGLMKEDNSILSGTVEIDEMYVGGNPKRNLRKRYIKKTPVVGMVSRTGKAKAKVVEQAETRTVLNIIKDNIKVGSTIMSDGSSIYKNKLKKLGFEHSVVKHSENEYVRGDVYTNSIEGFWSQIKRSIHGTYHAVSPKHLQSYVDEFSFRYNNRSCALPLFKALLVQLCGQRSSESQKMFIPVVSAVL